MTRNYRLTKEQSDEFCKTVKKVLKKIKVSQTKLGVIAGYSKQSMCMILGQRAETTTRSQYMSILSALSFFVVNSGLDNATEAEVFDMLEPIAKFVETF